RQLLTLHGYQEAFLIGNGIVESNYLGIAKFYTTPCEENPVIVQSRYQGRSAILNGLNQARLGFATNVLLEPAFFIGELKNAVLLREALAALYSVVVSDFKYRPRDRLAFMAWLEEQDRQFLAN